MMSPTKSAANMDAEMTLHNLRQVIEEHIDDYEMFAPDEILQANTDLLLHHLNHLSTLSLSQTKLINQLATAKSFLKAPDAAKKYSNAKIAYTKLLISLAELELG